MPRARPGRLSPSLQGRVRLILATRPGLPNTSPIRRLLLGPIQRGRGLLTAPSTTENRDSRAARCGISTRESAAGGRHLRPFPARDRAGSRRSCNFLCRRRAWRNLAGFMGEIGSGHSRFTCLRALGKARAQMGALRARSDGHARMGTLRWARSDGRAQKGRSQVAIPTKDRLLRRGKGRQRWSSPHQKRATSSSYPPCGWWRSRSQPR